MASAASAWIEIKYVEINSEIPTTTNTVTAVIVPFKYKPKIPTADPIKKWAQIL